MAAGLTYRQLLREVRSLAREIGRDTDGHRQLAKALEDEARDTGRIAEQISALKVDSATVAETREVGRIMQGISTAAIAYAAAATEAGQHARTADQQAVTDHDGIQQAVDSSPVEMADRGWYTQE
ncbi:hypothetical protein LN042_34320 [Kitasatospora sp. RB6PN24]|uniref:hypothetical protein n=1 Tax=Kitasatospora humi TaxID=2893891 RepID=UPI001E5DAC23|nr:hypothetical protein [Kitasatospora humi]MCC9312078.1 hypothetical protein [Kitasatospora humi]